jgi:hypothetical protein
MITLVKFRKFFSVPLARISQRNCRENFESFAFCTELAILCKMFAHITSTRGVGEISLNSKVNIFISINNTLKAISFPEHARSQVKGGHSSGEIELIQIGC